MGFRYGIASYKRRDCLHTLHTLTEMGYGKRDIIISTQTEKDYEEYQEAFGAQAEIIYRAAANDSQNRNTLIDYFDSGEEFLLLDDDIKTFCGLDEFGEEKRLRPIKDRAELEATFRKMFDYSEKHNSPMWAWYPVPNAFFMKNTVDLRNLFCATILGIKNNKRLRFDEEFDLKGDYELSLRLIKLGYNAVRFNGYTAEANHKSRGGCEDARKAGRNASRCAELLARYPTLVVPSHRQGEVRFVGKRGGKKDGNSNRKGQRPKTRGV